jgi:hypothetical protein
MFDPLSFDQLLGTPDFGSRLVWASAVRCPCFDQEGGTNPACPVCGGEAFIWEDWSPEFRAGLVGLTGRQLENISQRFGPGMVGDATVSLPRSSPPYQTVTQRDRFVALDAADTVYWSLAPGMPVKLPWRAVLMEARIVSGTALARVPVPLPDSSRRVTVTQATVIRLQVPRRYEVIADLSQARAIMPGLPRKVLVKLVDMSLR